MYGICIFKTDADIVDRQTLILKFGDGSTASHTMRTGITRPGRKIHIFSTKGEIEGFFEDSRYKKRLYNPNNLLYKEEEKTISGIAESDGHLGGDSRIVKDFVNVMLGKPFSVSATTIEDSINGHLCVYAADESMEKHKVVKI